MHLLKRKGFKGGVHPPDGKELSNAKAVVTLPVPEKVKIPLSQHIGAPAEPLVKVGDTVKKGQKIGEAQGYISVPIHASISGKVTALASFPHPAGKSLPSIQIESDGLDEWSGDVKENPNYKNLLPDEIKSIIQGAGIVGMGGAAFPTHVKLSPPANKKIDTLIINGAECEPYITADHRLMLEEPDRVIEGASIIARALSVSNILIGIEDNKPDAIRAMTDAAKNPPNSPLSKGGEVGISIKVVSLKVMYPQGGEKQLIKAVSGREVPSGGLPMDIGSVVHNVATAAAVYDAVRFGRPLIERIVTISGSGVNNPGNFKVRSGTSSLKLIEAAGGLKSDIGKVISGGPMMGTAQHTLDIPVTKGMSGLLFLPQNQVESFASQACIRCGRCVAVCPMGLLPNMLGIYAELDRFDQAEKANLMDCIECGSCAYVCPSKRPLVHLIRYAKADVMARRKKAA
ncbi:MAG: electron transport complex subunit RsxC [Deltaproteobacteria bacterium]|nr:electron transport complex subunit RsxC [Deltaproteobacteria bacterium]